MTAVAASLITPLAATPASADPALQCQTAAQIFVRKGDTGLDLKAHEEPEIGNPVWAPNRGIGFAWEGQMRTGPGGRVYTITPGGEIHKFRWNGNGWDNGGVRDVIATGWNGWGDAFARNRMMIDARGDFYGFPSDKALHWWRFDESSRKWTERIIDTGWGDRFDMIFSDGPGGIFARTTDGKLYRYQYDAESQRFVEYGRLVGGSGWGQFTDVASVGGGIFYALNGSNGQVKWYRYLGEGNWATDAGKNVGLGWPADWLIEGAPDACQILNYTPTPPIPALSPNATAPVAAYQGDDNLLNYFFVNSSGRLTQGRQRHTGDLLLVDHQDLTGYDKFTGEVGVGVYGDGKLEIQANGYEDASVRGRGQTAKNSASWTAAFDELGGRFVSAPVIVKDRDNLLVSFAVDSSGALWYRQQLVLWGAPVAGKFGAWRSLGGSGLTADFSVLRNGDSIDVIGRYTDGSARVSRFNGTSLEAARSTGASDVVGRPAAVVHADGKVQVVVRRSDNKIYTQREPFAGWQPVGSLVAAGSPAAVLTASGSLELSVRDTSGLVNTTGQSNPALPFRAWQVQDFTEAGTDTTMINLRGGDILLTWRDPMGEIYAYRGSFGSASARSAATGLVYTGGKTTS
ncbi:tachylectin-related carbohydrate-binding protein [Lentzea aerocolonigenes]|uniref:tachylectin-related carbohydrate-binding protein n=1 Tax=Lentzea aerocolonigenes TaxID=68170 RepID=UPI0012E2CDD0|nr:tachylectin-related carbohydrate-binding protein [Lentzea aerocolonigenes]